jgi:hypothetical protein
MSSLAVASAPGLDAVVNYTSPAEVCLQPALDAANQGLSNLQAVSEDQLISIQQLVALWNLDVMSEGMQDVVCPCCVMQVYTLQISYLRSAGAKHASKVTTGNHASDVLMCIATA